MKIVIDPGHGGKDPGAVGPTGLKEASVVLAIARLIADGLETAKLTREADVFIALGERCAIANDWGADYFLSIHLNSNGPSAVGIETLYKSEYGKALALPIQESLIKATGDRDRGLKLREDLYVLNGTTMPAILAEVGFISHPQTEAKFKTEEYRRLIAVAILEGLPHHE